MLTIHSTSEMKKWSADHSDKPIAAVYTMGALHHGHKQLMTFARSWVLSNVGTDCYVVVSIFVNPTQFNNEQDLEKYPRTLDHDLDVCGSAEVDAVFVPSVSEMYPEGLANVELLDAGELKNLFEGASRPGHFDGVVTVVNKLFSATQPQYAFFGEKDYQQLTVLKSFVERNKLPITVVGVPTVRAEDHVALSSRNSRLSAHGRKLAAHIPVALDIVQQATSNGVDIDVAITSAQDYLKQFSGIKLDYFVITSDDMTSIPTSGSARALVAVVIEDVRILDNMPIQIRNT